MQFQNNVLISVKHESSNYFWIMKHNKQLQFLLFAIQVAIVFSRMGPKPKPARMGPKPKPEVTPGAKGEPDKGNLGLEPLESHGENCGCVCFKPKPCKYDILTEI